MPIEKTFMIRFTWPPPLWGRAGWGVPKNKVAAEKWFPTVRESDSPIGMALLFGSLLPSLLLAFIFNPCF
jgi:hypothetical protein